MQQVSALNSGQEQRTAPACTHLLCCCFVCTSLVARLGRELVQDDRVVATAVLVFIASPASIHHSMLYTEALFTATSWLGLYCLYCCGSSTGASLAFAASSAVRSNGEPAGDNWHSSIGGRLRHASVCAWFAAGVRAKLCTARSSACFAGLLNAGFILHEHGRRTVADLYARQWVSVFGTWELHPRPPCTQPLCLSAAATQTCKP